MLLRPNRDEAFVVLGTVGKALLVLGLATFGLAALALLAGDVDSAGALAFGASLGVGAGTWTRMHTGSRRRLTWTTGVVAATTSWVACSLTASVPLHLSGHYASYPDALFEALSGLTTTGLTLVQDIDHMAPAMALYRHLLELSGALATVVVGLTLLTAATATSSSLDPSDVRDERIMPSVRRMWRIVAEVAGVVIGVGLVTTSIALAVAGVRGWDVLIHGISLTISAAATGGFALTSHSVGYYHSALVEIALIPLMLAGAVSFMLHRAAWRGERWPLTRELEVRVLVASILAISAVVMLGLGRSGSLGDVVPLFRRGLFTTIAAHTTTGLHNVSPRLLVTDWGLLAPAGLVAAMAVGGMTGSTAGGLKALRVGLIGKGIAADVRRVLLPEAAVVVSTFTWGRRRKLEHGHVRSSATLLLILLVASLGAATAVLFLDSTVNLTEALFMAVSAASNAGQTVGTLTPSDPIALKAGYGLLMLLGRLEWIAVFATFGFIYASLRGRQ